MQPCRADLTARPAPPERTDPISHTLRDDPPRALPAPLSHNEVTILSETFRLLGDPSRLRILLLCLDGPRSVGEIASTLDLTPSLVSHHLRLLRGARLVRGDRRAKQVFYALRDRHVSDMLADMASHVGEENTEEP